MAQLQLEGRNSAISIKLAPTTPKVTLNKQAQITLVVIHFTLLDSTIEAFCLHFNYLKTNFTPPPATLCSLVSTRLNSTIQGLRLLGYNVLAPLDHHTKPIMGPTKDETLAALVKGRLVPVGLVERVLLPSLGTPKDVPAHCFRVVTTRLYDALGEHLASGFGRASETLNQLDQLHQEGQSQTACLAACQFLNESFWLIKFK